MFWSLALDEDADLLLYGCEVTLDDSGNSFVRELSQVSKADISASVDNTGISGDWELENTVGEVEATSIFTDEIENAYQHILADGDITITPGDLPDFNNTDFSNTNFDFTNVSPDNLTIFAEAGLDFSNVDPSTLNNIDFNQVPAEDLEVLADAGLRLEPLSPEEISDINLNALDGLNYLQGVELSSIESLSGDTTFAQLSDSVVANANLFNYKNPTLDLESGLTVDKLSQFSQSDFKALDYAFTGDEAFDGNYYLTQNTDVRDAGINPFTHYIETGSSEGRDPNPTFDTSFYVDQNPDVRDAGVNPFEQYLGYAATDEINRYPNLVFQSFGTSEGTLVASADLSGMEFEQFKNTARESEVAFAPALAIPFIIVNGNTILAITAASLGAIVAASNIQELLGSSQPEIFVPEGDIDPSTPPFDLGEATRINPESFPNANDFLDDILNGQFEFPTDDGEGGAYFLTVDVYDESQGFTTSNKADEDADRFAKRVGGNSRQIFNSDSSQKEFDLVSDEYIGETKSGNPKVNKSFRVQAKRAFEAAQQTGREVYYEFETPPREEVIRRLNEYSERYGVNITIDVLNP